MGHGTTLFPGFDQHAYAGGSVDLRAQARDTTGVTYSWNTNGLTHANTIAGASTYNLTFKWNANAAGADWWSDSVTLTATNGSGKTEVQTFTFDLPGENHSKQQIPGLPSWPESLAPDTQRAAAPIFDSHNLSVDAASGSVDAAIALPAYNPNVPALTLAYDSMSADPRPGRRRAPHPRCLPGHPRPGHRLADAQRLDRVNLLLRHLALHQGGRPADRPAGRRHRPGHRPVFLHHQPRRRPLRRHHQLERASGSLTVLDESANALGAGWTLAGLERVMPATGGVILGLGSGRPLALVLRLPGAGGGTYTDPAGEFSRWPRPAPAPTPAPCSTARS